MELPQTAATYAERYQDSHLVVDFERETAYLDGTPMKLTAKAFSLLAFLVRHPGELVPRETLLMLVWGYGEEIRTRTLDVHIRRLRKSFGKYGTVYVETIFGVGYRFQPWRAPAKALVSTASPVMEAGPWRWKMEGNPAY
jgi:DNA-binding response OmpR family regulator